MRAFSLVETFNMAITCGIFGSSGDGKTTSLVINPDGRYYKDPAYSAENLSYEGMNPETTMIIASDRKGLSFYHEGFAVGKNVHYTSDIEFIMGDGIGGRREGLLQKVNAGTKYKSVIIDTINGIMVDTEMLESKKLTFDKWMDLAKNVYELVTLCNSLRSDLVVYLMGHVGLYTDIDGNESKCLVTNGRKLEKIRLESKLPIVLYTNVEKGTIGENKYQFETRKNRSTAKTPIGMFDSFLIPNSLSLVDTTIRKYYNIQ